MGSNSELRAAQAIDCNLHGHINREIPLMNDMIDKLLCLHDAFISVRESDFLPSEHISWFVSAALLSVDGTPAQVVELAQKRQSDANDIARETARQHSWLARQNWLLNLVSKITANRDWSETAITLGCGISINRFRELRLESQITKLSALALVAMEHQTSGAHVNTYKRNEIVTAVGGENEPLKELCVAAHLARNDTQESINIAQQNAQTVFASDKQSKRVAKTGARLCVALQTDASASLAEFKKVLTFRQKSKALQKVTPETLMAWVAQGTSLSDIEAIIELSGELSSHTKLSTADLFSLARLACCQTNEAGSLTALSAIFSVRFKENRNDGAGGA